MKVEIWSDILCPFCFIGKRKFQAALDAFPHRDQVQVIWRSFELDPNTPKATHKKIHELLAEKYGRSLEWALESSQNLSRQAAEVGLNFDFERLIPTNSFDAHRLLHLAQTHGKQDAMGEQLFSAYLEQGKNISDPSTLIQLAQDIGLDTEAARKCLQSDAFTQEVRDDESTAQSFGLQGVPAFVIDRRFLISGAQPSQVFTDALTKIWAESHPD